MNERELLFFKHQHNAEANSEKNDYTQIEIQGNSSEKNRVPFDSEVVVLLFQENELNNDENGEKKLNSGVMRNRGCIRKPSGTYALISLRILDF